MKTIAVLSLLGLLVPAGGQAVETSFAVEPVAIVQVSGAAGILG